MHEEITLLEMPAISAEEYLDMEARSPVKHEFNNGKLLEMAGGDYYHNKIKFEIAFLLEQLFRASRLELEVLDSDMKTWFTSLGKFVYPDVTVIAKPPQFYVAENGKIRRDAIVNPLLIIEVLSDDTRSYDKGEKFDYYCTLSSFREYLLVEPEKTWAKTIYLEDPANGLQRVTTYTDLSDSIFLHSLGYEIRLADIYRVLEGLNA